MGFGPRAISRPQPPASDLHLIHIIKNHRQRIKTPIMFKHITKTSFRAKPACFSPARMSTLAATAPTSVSSSPARTKWLPPSPGSNFPLAYISPALLASVAQEAKVAPPSFQRPAAPRLTLAGQLSALPPCPRPHHFTHHRKERPKKRFHPTHPSRH